jgi:hypothetical protein
MSDEYTYKIKYKKGTIIGIVISIVLTLCVAILNTRGLIRNYHKLSNALIIYGILFAVLMLTACIGLVFLLLKRKKGMIICISSLLINFIYGIIVGESPIELIIIFLPIILI